MPADNPSEAVPLAAHTNLARLLRHEVGDLLQSVYTTVAVLLERLPGGLDLERRLLADLKARAETCKLELDGTVELVTPGHSTPAPLDLAALTAALIEPLRQRSPALDVSVTTEGDPRIRADGRALHLALSLLAAAAFQRARHRLSIAVGGSDRVVSWALAHDGVPLTAEQLTWLEEPFRSTRQVMYGLALAVARRVAEAHGGAINAAEQPADGVRVSLTFAR